jgi:Na+:H+ antiporter, NhaA family
MAVKFGFSRLPSDVKWEHIIGARMLGGIGLTMSIFITNLAFHDNLEINNASKMSILLVSLTAGLLGFYASNSCNRKRVILPDPKVKMKLLTT